MLQCNHCGLVQDEGKFCGKCGGALVETPGKSLEVQLEQQAASKESPVTVSTSEPMDKVLESSKVFWAYFMDYLKQPSRIFSRAEGEFKNGLISILIVAILITLSFYTLVNNFSYQSFGYLSGDLGVKFLPVFGNGLIFIMAAIAIIISLLFLINKLFGTGYRFKEMTSVFGAHMTPAVVMAVVTFILILLKSNTYGYVFLLITLGLILTTIPLYLISSLLTRGPKGIDPLYGYILYLISVGIAFAIFISIVLDSAIGEFIGEIMDLYSYL